jgi:hypothetical protein
MFLITKQLEGVQEVTGKRFRAHHIVHNPDGTIPMFNSKIDAEIFCKRCLGLETRDLAEYQMEIQEMLIN